MLWDLFSLFPAHAGVILSDKTVQIPEYPFPRTRGGDPTPEVIHPQHFLLFPAHAGVIPEAFQRVAVQQPFPRTRGGDPLKLPEELQAADFSPHTRG